MELAAPSCVMSAPRRTAGETHKRRSTHSTAMRVRLAQGLRSVVGRRETVEVRAKLGDGNGGALRRDLGDIKSGQPARMARLGFERLLFMYDRLGLDPYAALSAPPATRVR